MTPPISHNKIRPKDGFDRRRFLAFGGGLMVTAVLASCSAATPIQKAVGTDLRKAIRGRVLLPDDPEFAAARMPWNRTVDQPVLAVVKLADAADATTLVDYARRTGLPISVQPNGHGAAPGVDGTILVRTTHLDETTIDPAARVARIGAGVAWDQVQRAAEPHGLTGLVGSSPAVSVVGYTLGGGSSWFGRKHGWAAKKLTAVEAVTADGNQVRATANAEPDLFWALSGGGGDFALVTAIEFGLVPAPDIYGGRMLWPAKQALSVFAAYREITSTAPDELAVWIQLARPPGREPLVGIESAYLGGTAEAERLLAPFATIDGCLSNTHAVQSVSTLGSITAEPTAPTPSLAYTQLLDTLDDSVVHMLLEQPIDPLIGVQIRHLAGAFTTPWNGPADAITAPYQITFQGAAPTPESKPAVQDRIQRFLTALAPHLDPRTPFTFLAPGQSATNAFTPGTLTELRRIKHTRDPNNLFRSNYPVLD